jgi:hypothetical protein
MSVTRFVRRPRPTLSRPALVGIHAPKLRMEALEDRLTPVFTPDPLFTAGTLPATGAPANNNGTPLNIVTGDFNGDGRQDFAGAAATGAKSFPRVDVFLSDQKAGSNYLTNASFSVGGGFGNPLGLAAVDVTADGKAEIVSVSTATGAVTVSRLENTGVFVTLASTVVDLDKSATPFKANLNLGGVTGGDFNGDNKGDFIVTLTGSVNGNQYVVLLNNGDGKSYTQIETPLNTGTAGTDYTAPISADFDQDGNLDFVMLRRSSALVSVMFGDGAGGFSFARNLSVTGLPNAIAVGDFDKNGRPDVAVGQSNGKVTVFLKDPTSNTFTTKQNAGTALGGSIVGMEAADYDVDGIDDLAIITAGSTAEVLLGRTDLLATAMVSANGSPFDPLIAPPGAIGNVDLDGNGNVDFVVGVGTAAGQVYTPYFNQSGVGGETVLVQDRGLAEFGDTVNYDVTIFPPPLGGPIPTGTVQFFDVVTDSTGAQTFVFLGQDALEPGLDNQGSSVAVAEFGFGGFAVAQHTVLAKYLGDGNYPAKNSNTVAVNVTKATTFAAVTPSATAPVFGQPVTLTADVSTFSGLVPPGDVVFFDNGNLIGTGTLDGAGRAAITIGNFTIGSHSIVAQYLGSPNFATTASAGVIVSVTKANSVTTLTASSLTGIFGDVITFKANVAIAAPGVGTATGTVEFFDGATKVAVGAVDGAGNATVNVPGLTVGGHTFTAKFVATPSVSASTSNAVTVTIAPTTSMATLVATPPTNEVGTGVVLSAFVNDTQTPPRPVLVGTVTFTGTDASGRAITVGPVPVANGVAAATITGLPQGTSTFSAAFSGTESITPAGTNAVQVLTERATPAVEITNSTGTTVAVVGKDVTFTVQYTPVNGLTDAVTGTVTFLDNGTKVLGTAALVNGQAAVTARLSLGAHVISVSYSGNPTYKPTTAATTFTTTRVIDPIAVGAGAGGSDIVRVYNPDGTISQDPLFAFGPDHTSGARVATGDVNGDGVPDRIIGTGPGTQARVRILDGATSAPLFDAFPFEDFTGGVFVASGDVNGDLRADFVVTPDRGGGPRVTVFDGASMKVLANFFGIDDPNFRGGARAALGDINNDQVDDLVVSAGFGGGPRVAAFDGRSVRVNVPVKLFNDFFAFESTLRNGTFAAVGDVDGDGFGDLIFGAGPGGGPRVVAYSGNDLLRTGGALLTFKANFFAGDANQRQGVPVAALELDGDGRADIVAGSGPGGRRVTAYLGSQIQAAGQPPVFRSFDAFDQNFNPLGGVFVG